MHFRKPVLVLVCIFRNPALVLGHFRNPVLVLVCIFETQRSYWGIFFKSSARAGTSSARASVWLTDQVSPPGSVFVLTNHHHSSSKFSISTFGLSFCQKFNLFLLRRTLFRESSRELVPFACNHLSFARTLFQGEFEGTRFLREQFAKQQPTLHKRTPFSRESFDGSSFLFVALCFSHLWPTPSRRTLF